MVASCCNVCGSDGGLGGDCDNCAGSFGIVRQFSLQQSCFRCAVNDRSGNSFSLASAIGGGNQLYDCDGGGDETATEKSKKERGQAGIVWAW